MEKNARIERVLLLSSALVVALLFQNREQGLNYLVVSALLVGLNLYLKQGETKSPLFYLLTISLLSSGIGVYLTGQNYSIGMWWLTILLAGGASAYPNFKNSSLLLNTFPAQTQRLFGGMALVLGTKDKSSEGRIKSWFRYFGVPAITLVILVSIYANANEFFGKSLSTVWQTIKNLFGDISFRIFLWFGFALVFITYFFLKENSQKLQHQDNTLKPQLIRTKKRSFYRFLNKRLLRKMQVAIMFFSVINLIIFWQHLEEIKNVWFGFEFSGQLLKGFVHEGTWLLIYALVISIGITWYYLDSNLVFMKKSNLFKTLIVIWLVQNLLLIAMVAVRNTYYVEFYALAYKRILVYFFLLFSAIALVALLLKVITKKSISFITNTLASSAIIVLPLAGWINWDVQIARYNFAHAEKAYLDYEFLKGMNTEAFAYMEKNQAILDKIDSLQALRFPIKVDSKEAYFANFVTEKQNELKEKGSNLDLWEQTISSRNALKQLDN